jgi:hypothetical protein
MIYAGNRDVYKFSVKKLSTNLHSWLLVLYFCRITAHPVFDICEHPCNLCYSCLH